MLGAALLSGIALPATGLWAGSASAASAAPTIAVPTSTILSTSHSPTFYHQPVTFTAVVTPTNGLGTVVFRNGGVAIPGCIFQPLHFFFGHYRATCYSPSVSLPRVQIVLRDPTHLRANIFFNYHQTFTVTGRLDSFFTPVAHQPLIFRTGHTFLCVAFTNSHGIGACLLSYAKSVAIRQNAGRFTVIYPGSFIYQPSIAFGQGIIHP
ncbi:MAG: hypothetical protein ABSB01_12350 [Streptosporangiaceae bacterium]